MRTVPPYLGPAALGVGVATTRATAVGTGVLVGRSVASGGGVAVGVGSAAAVAAGAAGAVVASLDAGAAAAGTAVGSGVSAPPQAKPPSNRRPQMALAIRAVFRYLDIVDPPSC